MTYNGREIETHFVNPPIPFRGCDYCATLHGYDGGDPVGYGETKQDAIDSLIEALES